MGMFVITSLKMLERHLKKEILILLKANIAHITADVLFAGKSKLKNLRDERDRELLAAIIARAIWKKL